jgi:hypothetical protein
MLEEAPAYIAFQKNLHITSTGKFLIKPNWHLIVKNAKLQKRKVI